MPIRAETRVRVRALQLLYGWDIAGTPETWGAPRPEWGRVAQLVFVRPRVVEGALGMAERVVKRRPELDAHIVRAADRWRLERLGVIERNVLRLGTLELAEGEVPPKVVLDEAVRLAQWFGGEKSPGFVNGILDRVARDLGRL
jgi:N utilization substance protein B